MKRQKQERKTWTKNPHKIRKYRFIKQNLEIQKKRLMKTTWKKGEDNGERIRKKWKKEHNGERNRMKYERKNNKRENQTIESKQ